MSGASPGKRLAQQSRHRGLAASITTMKCAQCGAEGPAGMKFCGQCGAPLVSACPSCGADTPHKILARAACLGSFSRSRTAITSCGRSRLVDCAKRVRRARINARL